MLRVWFDDLDPRDGDRLGLGRRRVRDARNHGVLDPAVLEDERAQAGATSGAAEAALGDVVARIAAELAITAAVGAA